MPENSSKNPDSIPTISFAALLSIFFKAISAAIKDFIGFFFRHKILLIIAILAGVIMGFVNFKTSRVYYKVSMMVRHNVLTPKVYGHMLNSLNTLAESGSSDALAKSLAIDKETSQKIRSIGAVNLGGIDIRNDTATSGEGTFLIQMTILDNAIADTLGKVILNYFNNKPYLNRLKQDEIHIYTERLDFMNNELGRMDSLNDAYNRSLASSKGSPTFYNNVFNPADVYKEADLYSINKAKVQEWLLQKRSPLVSIDDIKQSVVPYSIDMPLSVFMYTVIFFFAGCFVAGIIEFAKK